MEFDKNAWSSILFFFAGDIEDGSELYARMVAPLMGVEEDLTEKKPRTGMPPFVFLMPAGLSAPRRKSCPAP